MAPPIGPYSQPAYKLSIEHSIGLEKLNGKKFSEHQKCLLCMIGKSKLNDKPESIKLAEKPLAKVNFDLISSSVTSIEGYNYCAVLTDDCSEYRLAYGPVDSNQRASLLMLLSNGMLK
jgi:hypothetical protein